VEIEFFGFFCKMARYLPPEISFFLWVRNVKNYDKNKGRASKFQNKRGKQFPKSKNSIGTPLDCLNKTTKRKIPWMKTWFLCQSEIYVYFFMENSSSIPWIFPFCFSFIPSKFLYILWKILKQNENWIGCYFWCKE
jgi:hypothetical protein